MRKIVYLSVAIFIIAALIYHCRESVEITLRNRCHPSALVDQGCIAVDHTQAYVLNADSLINHALENKQLVPIWTLEATNEGLVLNIDTSINPACTQWMTEVRRHKSSVWIESWEEPLSVTQCSSESERVWERRVYPLPLGFYDVEWRQNGQTILAGRYSVSY